MTPIRWILFWAALSEGDSTFAVSSLKAVSQSTILADGDQYLMFSDLADSLRAPKKVWEAFIISDDYQSAMSLLGVSRGTLIRWLEDDPDLRSSWRRRLRNGRLGQTQDRLRHAIASDPSQSRDDFSRQFKSDCAWLREHFPDVLRNLLAFLPSRMDRQGRLFNENRSL